MSTVRDYLGKLATLNATELLLSSERPPLYRALQELLPLPGTAELRSAELERLLEVLLSPDELRVLGEQQHVSCIKQLDSGERLRVFCHAAAHGYTLKLALLNLQNPSRSEPALPPLLRPLMAAKSGLIIVAGPAGSGKSALVSHMLDQLAGERGAYVMTVEDPVLYSAPRRGALIVQRAVGRHCTSHAQGVEAALAARADVIACSNLAAPLAFERMLEAAGSGVLAIGELRANAALGALEQLLQANGAAKCPLLARELSEALLAVLSLDQLPAKSGGRIMALEVLRATPALSELLRAQNLDEIVTLYDREPGMQSMDRSLLELVSAGLVEGHEAYLRAADKSQFRAWE
jgi:Tfp pilus assembly pilus retraction ATPase PilT